MSDLGTSSSLTQALNDCSPQQHLHDSLESLSQRTQLSYAWIPELWKLR